jgi:hypothetical protein
VGQVGAGGDQVSRLSNYIGGVLLFTGFSTDRAKGRNLHTDARCLRSVASRSAASAQTPDPPGDSGAAGGDLLSSVVQSWARRGFLTTQRGSISVGLIGQAVGLFASTNIGDDLDRQTADHHEHKFYE